jgi:hypothetical protein
MDFRPYSNAFLCQRNSFTGAFPDETFSMQGKLNVHAIPVMCLGWIESFFVLHTFQKDTKEILNSGFLPVDLQHWIFVRKLFLMQLESAVIMTTYQHFFNAKNTMLGFEGDFDTSRTRGFITISFLIGTEVLQLEIIHGLGVLTFSHGMFIIYLVTVHIDNH